MKDFLRSYLFSFLFWIDLPLGALPLLMTYHLTGGNWGKEIQKILESLCATLLLFVLLVIPILVWAGEIYPWLDPTIAADPGIQHKSIYLNQTFFTIRAVLYFVCWLGTNALLKSSFRAPGGPSRQATLRRVSAGGFVVFGLTVTFASIDWQMSVEPKWYSTIYGMVYAAGQALGGFAFALSVFGFTAKRVTLASKQTLWDLGNILLTLVILWAYLSFMQYLIVWSGNLPSEVIWFQHRVQGGWQWLALLLALFQFTAPFVFLLFRTSKDRPIKLALLGILVFIFRAIDHYWMLMPGFVPDRFQLPWQAVVIWVVMGGIWLAVFLRIFSKRGAFEVSGHA